MHITRVQEGIDAVDSGGKHATVIAIQPGTYFEQVRVPCNKTNILLRVASVEEGGTGGGEVEANAFTAEGIVFENAAGPQCGGASGQNQAVAVRVTAERAAFHQCSFLGWQDTLYLHRGSAWFRDCRVEGSVDFIFGGPKARGYWKGCEVAVRGRGWVTAHRRDLTQWPDDTNGAFVFDACSVQDAPVLMHGCSIGAVVKAEGWGAWNSATDVSRPRFLKWGCTGPRASLAHV
ncbi:unnamed protein product [Closterium sp. Yama58-4]|nr:unnamed protein product [Closterium sp. Yama58-4]